MKRVWLVICLIVFSVLPCYSYQEDILQNIFITDVPEPAESPKTVDEIGTLRGYAEYIDGEEELYLTDDDGKFVLNLKEPQKIESESLLDNSKPVFSERRLPQYSKFTSEEYRVSDIENRCSEKIGNFSLGTGYGSSISTTQLEREASLFTRYEYKNFALNSSYKKTLGTTGGIYYDNIYFTPEYKLNNIFTLKDEMSYDPVRNRRKNSFILSINPFGNSEKDRMNFEVKAGQTYDQYNSLVRTQFEFNTKFKL